MKKLLSYKEYKILNETLGSPITLGLGRPNNLGLRGNHFSAEDLEEMEIEEGKKKKKKMRDGEEFEIDAETGDGEVIDKDGVPPKHKPDLDSDDDDEEDLDDERSEFCKKAKKYLKKEAKKNMMGCPEKDDDEEDEEDEEDDEDLDDMEGEELSFSKKKAKKHLKKEAKKNMGHDVELEKDLDDDEEEDLDDEDLDGEELEGDDEVEGGDLGMMKRKVNRFMKKKSKKKMTKEETDWWTSVHSMINHNPDAKFSSGFSALTDEQMGLTPRDTYEEVPGPGEPGFAPSGRVGS